MYQSHGWWFPDQDTHFAEMLSKNIAKGKEAVYQVMNFKACNLKLMATSI
jgi:hypothetical protein